MIIIHILILVIRLKINKKLIFYILLPLVVGGIGYLLGGSTDIYEKINQPSFAPPSVVFPIVWTILYILMGISSYMISKENNPNEALKVYYIQLFFNMLWSMFFFRFQLFLFSSIWLFVLLALVIYMIMLFVKKKKMAGYLQIPYALWCTFAFILNIAVYVLNG